jgi:Ni,Fe-hydrogenase I cytochrome b subunit
VNLISFKLVIWISIKICLLTGFHICKSFCFSLFYTEVHNYIQTTHEYNGNSKMLHFFCAFFASSVLSVVMYIFLLDSDMMIPGKYLS